MGLSKLVLCNSPSGFGLKSSQVFRLNHSALAENKGVFNDILQFPDIAWEIMTHQHRHGGVRDSGDIFAPLSLLNFSTIFATSTGMSSRRSRRGGMSICTITFKAASQVPPRDTPARLSAKSLP